MESEMQVRGYVYGWLLCCVVFVLPFASVTFTPISDAPQQLAQIKFFWSSFEDQSPYIFHWWYPNHLSYLFLGIAWWLFGPLSAAGWGMWLVGVVWLAGWFFLAWRCRRPWWWAFLLGLFFFHFSMYWGFYNHLSAMMLFWFALAWWLVSPSERTPQQEFLGALAWSLLLYQGHILFWGMAGLMVGLWLPFYMKERGAWWRIAGLLPSVCLTLLWMAHNPIQTQNSTWFIEGVTRWSLIYWTGFSMGVIRGQMESVFLFLVFFIAISAWAFRLWTSTQTKNDTSIESNTKDDTSTESNTKNDTSTESNTKNDTSTESNTKDDTSKKDETETYARSLMICACFLAIAVMFLPKVIGTTIYLPERWIVPLFLLFLLAAPIPQIPRWMNLFPVLFVLWFVVETTKVWVEIEVNEYKGLKQSLDALPEAPSVLGLDLVKRSRYLRTDRPFMHASVYGQVLKGGRNSFSFAEYPTGLVYFKKGDKKPWTEHLEWFPKNLKTSDFLYFSHAIVSGSKRQHQLVKKQLGLKPLTHKGIWRLYKVP